MENDFIKRHDRVQSFRKRCAPKKAGEPRKKQKVDEVEVEEDEVTTAYKNQVKGLQSEYKKLAAEYLEKDLNEEVKKKMDKTQDKILKLKEVLNTLKDQ